VRYIFANIEIIILKKDTPITSYKKLSLIA
jgi:hypothetical protein